MQSATQFLSAWAARHPRQAIPLIVLVEIANILIGIMVGSALLTGFSSLALTGLITGMILLRRTLSRYAQVCVEDMISHARFQFQKRVFFGLFIINLMTSTLAGSIVGHVIEYPEATTNLYGRMTTVYESSSNGKKISLREKMPQKYLKRNAENSANKAWMRLGYVGLFLLGIVLAYFGTVLGCSLICSEMAFLGIMVLLLSTGVLAGGFYFLGRGIDKNMKPFQEMTRDERKRESRRYWRTLLMTFIVLLVIIFKG
ncbi:hypothetical protein [Runella sp.]|uniref:hypothetical protein n=1 Tax=Runella sp. TaxID=1960881 RepID=UPI00261B3D95|nr:hypothetical protein [Runella sp.]